MSKRLRIFAQAETRNSGVNLTDFRGGMCSHSADRTAQKEVARDESQQWHLVAPRFKCAVLTRSRTELEFVLRFTVVQ